MATGMLARLVSSDAHRRLLLTVGVLCVYRLGCQIPLPGLDLDTLSHAGTGRLTLAPIVIERISIFALGVMPIFWVLMIVEIAKLVVPALGRWETARPGHVARLHRHVYIAALVLAAFHAFRMANAFEGISGLVDEPGWTFHVSVVATFVAATALLGWLGEMITLHGLGNGFWLLLVTPSLARLPNICFEFWRRGGVVSAALVAAICFLVAAIALVVTAGKARYGRTARRHLSTGIARPEFRVNRADLAVVWPAVLANYVGLPFISFGGTVHLFVIAALIAAFTYLRSRSAFNNRPADVGAISERSDAESASRPAWIIALAQIVVCAGGELLTRNLHLPFSINGSWIIIVVTVATSCLASIGVETRSWGRKWGRNWGRE